MGRVFRGHQCDLEGAHEEAEVQGKADKALWLCTWKACDRFAASADRKRRLGACASARFGQRS